MGRRRSGLTYLPLVLFLLLLLLLPLPLLLLRLGLLPLLLLTSLLLLLPLLEPTFLLRLVLYLLGDVGGFRPPLSYHSGSFGWINQQIFEDRGHGFCFGSPVSGS